MIAKIIGFELKERLTHWLSWVFFLMLVFQGVWYTKGTFDYYVNDGVLMNAPSIFYKNFAGLGMLMVIMIVILTGGFLYKDIQHKTANWMYAFPMNEKRFFAGRYLSAFLINLILGMGYFVGMLLVPYSGIGEVHRFGAAPIGQMLHAILIFLIPNLLLFTSIIIFTLVYTRRMAASYLAAFMVILFFVVMESTVETSGYTPFGMLADPNGWVAVSHQIDQLTSVEKNTSYIRLSGYLLANRLLWIGISTLLFVLAYRKFTFKGFIGTGNKKEKTKYAEQGKNVVRENRGKAIPVPKLSFGTAEKLKKTFGLSILEFNNIVRPVGFKIVAGILILMILLQNLMWNASYYIGPEISLTSGMTYFRLAWGVIITLLLMVWAGELFFKDKVVNIWQITDALPVPVWVTQLSKLFAIMAVAFVLCLVFVLTGILCQLALGGAAQIDLPLYIKDVLGFRWGWLTFVLQICMVFFIGGLTGKRYATHIISVGIFLITIISFDMGLFEQVRYGYPLVPGVDNYSEMSGYGIWDVTGRWFFLMWGSLGIVFVLFGILFWDRGQTKKWYRKLNFSGKQLNIYGKLAGILFLIMFIFLQGYIGKHAYSPENFKSSSQEDIKAADYEKKYKHLERIAQPKYVHVDMNLDFYPQKRKAAYKAKLTLVNPSSTPIDTLYLNFKDFVKLVSITSDTGPLEELSKDTVHHVLTYRLPKVLDSAGTFMLQLIAEKQYTGFTQDGAKQTDIMFNGSFGNVKEFLPVIGYDDEQELDENRTRADEGLPRLVSRMAPIDDQTFAREDAYARDALWTTGRLVLSTDKRQTCIAPGKRIKQWNEGKRNLFEFEIGKPAPFDWYIGSAEYAVLQKGKQNGVNYEIQADPKHPFNIPVYKDAIVKGMDFIKKHLGPYPYDELRLVEINHYHDARYAFPNTIAISEKEGWVADTSGLKEKAYLYLTVMGEIAEQWLNTKVHIANVQGADMFKKALPEAIALQFVEETLGTEAVQLLIDKKMEVYGKEHNNEPNQEPPLLYADGADYLEINKGAAELYRFSKTLGFNKFNKLLVDYAKNTSDEKVVFKTLYDYFSAALPSSEVAAIAEKFETIN